MLKSKATFSYQIEKARRHNRQIIAYEYLTFIGILFQDQVESGFKRIHDFKDLTMLDVQDEIMLRTRMITADNQRKIRKAKEEQDKRERELLERLKKMQ